MCVIDFSKDALVLFIAQATVERAATLSLSIKINLAKNVWNVQKKFAHLCKKNSETMIVIHILFQRTFPILFL